MFIYFFELVCYRWLPCFVWFLGLGWLKKCIFFSRLSVKYANLIVAIAIFKSVVCLHPDISRKCISEMHLISVIETKMFQNIGDGKI